MRFFDIADTSSIDLSKLMRQLPERPAWNPLSTQGQYISAILRNYQMFRDNGINTPQRLAYFLAQGLVETNYLQAKSENLNYSFQRLKEIFGRHFANDDEIRSYAGQRERIANRVYANRLGNGPEESGDGWRYRGRGFFQLTGKDNYQRYSEVTGVDLMSDPDILSRDLDTSLKVAAIYFRRMGLADFADANDAAAVSRGVNRGNPRDTRPSHGEASRIEWTRKAMALVENPQAILQDAAASAPAEEGALQIGAAGPNVALLQEKLRALGYSMGAEEAVFGPDTRRAVLNFQEEHGLTITGIADAATRTAIDAAQATEPAHAPNRPTPTTLPPDSKPLGQSRTILGAILAGIAGVIEFVRASVTQFANAFPVVNTPYGAFNTIYILAAVLTLGLAIVIYARLDDRAKKRR